LNSNVHYSFYKNWPKECNLLPLRFGPFFCATFLLQDKIFFVFNQAPYRVDILGHDGAVASIITMKLDVDGRSTA
jgi:hypothetical protein